MLEQWPRPSRRPKDHWVLPGERSFTLHNPTDDQLNALHKQAYIDGYTVDLSTNPCGDVRAVFNEIVVDASRVDIASLPLEREGGVAPTLFTKKKK